MNTTQLLGRPYFSTKQVRTTRGIKRGNLLIKVSKLNRSWPKIKVLVLSEPYTKKVSSRDGSLWVDIIYLEGPQKGYVHAMSLADHSVISYGKVWNKSYYFIRTGRKRLSEKQIGEVVKKIYKNRR
jgi:hypothetical protein